MSTLEQKRHSLAHLLAAAVMELWPDTKRTIGPAIDNGFYYDFEFSKTITEDVLKTIKEKMLELLPTWNTFDHAELTATEAKAKYPENQYKHELIDEFTKDGQKVTFYTSGNFFDLCRGGHVENMKEINHGSWKLDRLAGAYWRGDEKNTMLTRIYGLAFDSKEDLNAYITQREEAKKRDHRKLGKELGLFTLVDEIGAGLPLFYPKGALLRRQVENYITELQESRGYQPIWIPHITKGQLYEMSGHLQKYDAMYPPMTLEGEDDYYLKPMNCPHFMMLYKSEPHSYRELPVRWTCTTTNYRYEKSGELSGLTRVRALTQDDCHVFMRPDQIEQETNVMLDMISEVYKTFGFNDFWVRISTHDPKNKEKYIGDPAVWKDSEATLEKLIKTRGWKYEIGVGEAAFYGPKLDFIFCDVLSREWQLSTIQLDMNLPERFDLEYVDAGGTKVRPVVIHRAILGSTERFLGILIEHYGGSFPVWLAPVQVKILSVGEAHQEYCLNLTNEWRALGFRVEVDMANESIGKKIRTSEAEKVPYTLVVGDKEMSSNDLAVRVHGQKDLLNISKDEFITKIRNKVSTRTK